MKNNKNWYKILSAFMIAVLLVGTITTTASANKDDQVLEEENVILNEEAEILEEEIEFPEEVEVSEEDIELLAKSLELITTTGQMTEKDQLLGFNKQKFEEELMGLEGAEEVIQLLEQEDLFVESPEPTMSTFAVACAWYGMKDKPAYLKAENTCLINGIKSNYGYVAIGSTIANLVADKEFKLAAKKILQLGVRSNIAGVVFTLSSVLMKCSTKMNKLYPGKTNCY